MMLAACGYSWPEGDAHPEVRHFLDYVGEDGGLRRLNEGTGVGREAVVDFYWPVGSQHAFAIFESNHPKDRAFHSFVHLLRVYDADFDVLHEVELGSEWGRGLYVDESGTAYFAGWKVGPPDYAAERLPCVELKPDAGMTYGDSREQRCETASLAEVEALISRASAIVTFSDEGLEPEYLLISVEGAKKLVQASGYGEEGDGRARIGDAVSASGVKKQVTYTPAGYLDHYDQAVIGNSSHGNHVAFWFNPINMDYYQVEAPSGMWRFKVGDRKRRPEIKAYEAMDGQKVFIYTEADPHYFSDLYLLLHSE